MTKDQLLAALEPHPGGMQVVIEQENYEFDTSPVESVRVSNINYAETPGGKTLATDKVIIISDGF